MKDNKRNILITGASDGIGAALAKRYASPDTRLILLARSGEKLITVAQDCEKKKSAVLTYSIDVTKTQALQDLVSEIDAKYPIDLVICNAGVTSIIPKSGEAESWQAISNVIDTNLYGVLATLNPLINSLRKRQHGQIAIVSSLAAHYGMAISPVYCASKSALKAYGQALRGWLKADGIGVSVIYPGFVKSSLSDQFHADKPFIVSPERAADIIYNGLQKNKASISFPFPLNLGMWALSVLPSPMADWIMGKLYGINNNEIKSSGAKRN